MKLEGKSALVTGGGSGIGRAIAIELARAGASVTICDVRLEGALGVVSIIEAMGEHALAVKADVSKKSDVLSAVEAALSAFKKIDILINNAGIYRLTPLEEISEEEWDLLLGVNVKGTFFFSQAVVAHMKERKAGKIINIASTSAISGGLLAGIHYSTSKAAIVGFTRSLARMVARYGILVNAIAPGRIDTPSIKIAPKKDEAAIKRAIPLGKLGTPEHVARVALFLASEDSNYMTGTVVNVSGGLQIP
jgi:NAD(P)-dependent dehydrogenase (short-subunit alcohol dehydrogenase family)